MTEKKALIAMSGGVDSSTAAYLMQQAGYDCRGVMMRLYQNEDVGLSVFSTCCSQRDIADAEAVAARLGIPFRALNLTAEFHDEIIGKFIRTYEQGGTPNPCIDCNRYMKFERLLQYALEQGCDCVVTGHYARIEYDDARGRWLLKKAVDASKDQSYVLYHLTQAQMAHTRFPLGGMTKAETRALAASLGLVNAQKHDSQDICFVPDGDYGAFMERQTGKTYPAGDFVDSSGSVIGRHRGAVRYTVGQRRGLNLPMGERVYVLGKDMAQNTVTVGPEAALFSREVMADDLNWIAFDAISEPIRCKAKLRYRMVEQPCTVSPAGEGRVRIVFDEAQRAATVGQSAVFYDGDTVLGGGTICE